MAERRGGHEPKRRPAAGPMEPDFDGLLMVLGNNTRRRLLERIVSETHYPLQLARELRISQQAVAKHLRVLEESHLVYTVEERSDIGGPPRKGYYASASYSLNLTIGPRLFSARLARLHEPDSVAALQARTAPQRPAPRPGSVVPLPHETEFRQILRVQNHKDRIRSLYHLMQQIDRELQVADDQRSRLLEAKQRAATEATAVIEELYPDYRMRSVLYRLFAESGLTPRELAEELDLREGEVESALERLIDDNVVDPQPRRRSRR